MWVLLVHQPYSQKRNAFSRVQHDSIKLKVEAAHSHFKKNSYTIQSIREEVVNLLTSVIDCIMWKLDYIYTSVTPQVVCNTRDPLSYISELLRSMIKVTKE